MVLSVSKNKKVESSKLTMASRDFLLVSPAST